MDDAYNINAGKWTNRVYLIFFNYLITIYHLKKYL